MKITQNTLNTWKIDYPEDFKQLKENMIIDNVKYTRADVSRCYHNAIASTATGFDIYDELCMLESEEIDEDLIKLIDNKLDSPLFGIHVIKPTELMIKNINENIELNNELIVIASEVYTYDVDNDVLTEIDPYAVALSDLSNDEFVNMLLGIDYEEPMLMYLADIDHVANYFERVL